MQPTSYDQCANEIHDGLEVLADTVTQAAALLATRIGPRESYYLNRRDASARAVFVALLEMHWRAEGDEDMTGTKLTRLAQRAWNIANLFEANAPEVADVPRSAKAE